MEDSDNPGSTVRLQIHPCLRRQCLRPQFRYGRRRIDTAGQRDLAVSGAGMVGELNAATGY